MGEVMTKHSVTRWYHLAIAAVVPLVLTVCATPISISPLGDLDLDVDAPSSTALAAVEPEAPVLPLIEVAAAPKAVQPALDAGLLGVGGGGDCYATHRAGAAAASGEAGRGASGRGRSAWDAGRSRGRRDA